jgi:hypothetical protein
MLDEEFKKQRAQTVRDLAEKAARENGYNTSMVNRFRKWNEIVNHSNGNCGRGVRTRLFADQASRLRHAVRSSANSTGCASRTFRQ